MKGVFFKQPLEFKLEVQGDEWFQGQALVCTLSIKNRGSSSEKVADPFLCLAHGSIKQIKEKKAEAFAVDSAARLAAVANLAPGQEQGFNWTFELDRNCLVSDKTQSAYLICGKGAMADTAGQLAVTVKPHPHIEAMLSLFEVTYAFVTKGLKSRKGWLEAKLKPPAGKEFPTLDHLLVAFRFAEEKLCLKYCFHLKTLKASVSTLEVSKATRELEQELPCSKYLFPGGQINHEPLEAAIGEILAMVKSKM